MTEALGVDVIETSHADKHRRRWPWVTAGCVVVLAVTAVIVVPRIKDNLDRNAVQQIAAAWADRNGYEAALEQEVNTLFALSAPDDASAVRRAIHDLNSEVGDSLDSIRRRISRVHGFDGSVRRLETAGVAALMAETNLRRQLPSDAAGLTTQLPPDVTRLVSLTEDRLEAAGQRWHVAMPKPTSRKLQADSRLRARLSRFLDEPLPWQLLVNWDAGPSLLDLANNRTLSPPIPLTRAGTVVLAGDTLVTLQFEGRSWVLSPDSPPRHLPGGAEPALVFPAEGRAVWVVDYLGTAVMARLVPTDGRRLGRPFRLFDYQIAGGTSEGLVIEDVVTVDRRVDGPPSDRLSRLVLLRPDGIKNVLDHGCDVVVGARNEAVAWAPCANSRRPHLLHLTNIATGRDTVVRPPPGWQVELREGGTASTMSPDGRWLASTWTRDHRDATGVVNVRSGRVELLPGPMGDTRSIAWSPDSRQLFFAVNEQISVWHADDRSVHGVRFGEPGYKTVVAVLPANP